MKETWIWSLGWGDPLEEEIATHSSILAWRITWTEEPGGLQFIWLQLNWDQFIRSVMSLQPHGLQHDNLPVHGQLPEFTQSHFHWVSNVIPPSHPLSSPSPSTFNLSQPQVFSIELYLRIRWPKCWSFSLSISPSNEYSRLISFRMDWLDLYKGSHKHNEKEYVLLVSV